jgi:integrase/recombinase XerD
MSNKDVIVEYATYLKSRGLSIRTIKEYPDDVRLFFERVNKHYSEITKLIIRDYIIKETERGNVGSTINRRLVAINSFFSFLNEMDILSNKIRYKSISDKGKKERRAKRDYIRPDEFETYIDKNVEYLRDHPCFLNARRWVLLYLLMYGGIRENEAAHIEESNISIIEKDGEDQYKIYLAVAKGDKPRNVYIRLFFREPLDLYLKLKKKWNLDTSYLLCTVENKPMHVTAISDTVEWLTKKAGFDKHITPHRLRDAHVDYLTVQKCDIETISSGLGHEKVKTTIEHYMGSHPNMQVNIPKFFKEPATNIKH